MTPEIILGPPGTGKTTTLLSIVDEELSRGVAPDRIAYVSFTRRAANEAIERACEKFKLKPKDLPYFRTLHSLCYRWLGMRASDVMEDTKIQEFADYVGIRITGRWTEDGTFSGFEEGDRIMFMENLSRIRRQELRETYERDNDGIPWIKVERVAKAFHNFKQERSLIDYTDMLSEFVEQCPNLGLEVVVVDEAQDLSTLQWDVVNVLWNGVRRGVVAGDDDQAIYVWAGANVQRLITMEGSVRVLGQSWRVPRKVQAVAHDVINRVHTRRPKEWSPRDVDGKLERLGNLPGVSLLGSDILILTRNIYVLRDQVEPILRNRGILYDHNGIPSVKVKLRSAIVNWERLRRGEAVEVEEARNIYSYMSSGKAIKRGFKTLPTFADGGPQVTLNDLKTSGGLLIQTPWFEALDRMEKGDANYIRAARSIGEKINEKPRVRVSTIHSAKGAEADHVVLMTEMGRKTFREAERFPDDESRVWYVGVTRAREQLTLVDSQTPQGYDL